VRTRVRWQEVIERVAIIDVDVTDDGDVDREALFMDLADVPDDACEERDSVDLLLLDWDVVFDCEPGEATLFDWKETA
jgi:hypothetical protein